MTNILCNVFFYSMYNTKLHKYMTRSKKCHTFFTFFYKDSGVHARQKTCNINVL